MNNQQQSTAQYEEPLIVSMEEAPIIELGIIYRLARAYVIYAGGKFGDVEYHGTFDESDHAQVFEIMWEVRTAAKEAVRTRNIPVDGSREVFYEHEERPIDGRNYMDVTHSIPKACMYYEQASAAGDNERLELVLRALNFHLLGQGFAALEQEHVGHYGRDEHLRIMEQIETDPDTASMHESFEVANRHLRDWNTARSQIVSSGFQKG